MTVDIRPVPEAAQISHPGIIDCDLHPVPRNASDLRRYLSPAWHQHFDEIGGSVRQPFVGGDIYPRAAPYLSRRDAFPPKGGPPGCDLDFMRAQHLDPHNVAVGLLQVLGGGSGQRNLDYGAALSQATNDWQVAEWLDPEPRLRGSINIPQDDPEASVAEIRRVGRDRRFAQVSFTQRTMEPAGARRYWPIIAAAVEHDLPLGIHTGGYNGYAPVPGGGFPSTYAEQHHGINIAMQALLASLVMEGVFARFPRVRVLLVEGGFSWVPALGWRLDRLWRKLRAEVPLVTRPPSEIIREHVWFTTQPMDGMGGASKLRQVIDWVGWDRLCFSSDYPHWDYDDSRHAFSIGLTDEQRRAVFRDNARTVLGLKDAMS